MIGILKTPLSVALGLTLIAAVSVSSQATASEPALLQELSTDSVLLTDKEKAVMRGEIFSNTFFGFLSQVAFCAHESYRCTASSVQVGDNGFSVITRRQIYTGGVSTRSY